MYYKFFNTPDEITAWASDFNIKTREWPKIISIQQVDNVWIVWCYFNH